jgi:hypothetical protein
VIHGGISIRLPLHSGQSKVFNDPRRFKVVVAGRRWGKTRLSLASIVRAATEKKKQLVWYVAPTYRMARQIMWPVLMDTLPKSIVVRHHETMMRVELINGSVIELKGADKPDTLRGVQLDYVVIDEAQDIKHDTWVKVLRPTLVTTGGSALFIGTPKFFNWLYDIYQDGQKGDIIELPDGRKIRNQWASWQYPTSSSPFVPKSEIESAKADMDEKSFNQEFEAKFETMSGRVYYPFDRRIHVGRYTFNPKLPIWIGQDFNIDPMSSVIMQPQKDGEVWIVDECVLYGSNTEETADELARRYHRYMSAITMYPDPAGKNRAHTRGESDLQILREKGFKKMKYRKQHPPVSDRVNAVNRMLFSANGAVRLRVNEKCKKTIESFEQTIYKAGTREIDKSLGTDHQTDALGYCIHLEFPVRGLLLKGISV